MSFKPSLLAAATAAALLSLPTLATANLVLQSTVDLTGQGIGAQFTVLTLQSPGSSTTESGGVAFSGTPFGDAMTGASQTRSFTFADLSLTNAFDLRLIVNLNEPGSESPPSVVAVNSTNSNASLNTQTDSVTLNVFSASGTLLQSNSLALNTTLLQQASGVGGSGLVLGLDFAQGTALNGFIAANPGAEVFTVGATFANAAGGVDVIQAARFTGGVAPIPEPETYALMLAGLGVVGFVARRRKPAA